MSTSPWVWPGRPLLIAQALIIAGLVADAFDGRTARASSTPLLVALAVVVAVRAALSGAAETIGRRAAARVMSDLRLALVRRRLSSGSRAPADPMAGAASSPPLRSPASTRWRSTSLATCPSSCWPWSVPVAVLGTSLVVDPLSAASCS